MVRAGGMVPVAENCSFLNHIPSWAAEVAAMNSASVVDRAVADAWILDAQEMAPPWLRKTYPVVDFLVIGQAAWSESQ